MTLHNQSHINPRLGGMVTVTPIRDRLVEHEAAFSITWHSPRRGLRWFLDPYRARKAPMRR